MSEECIQHVCNPGCWVLLGHSRFVGHRPDLEQMTVIRNEGSKGMNSWYGSKSQLTWKRCIKRPGEQLRGKEINTEITDSSIPEKKTRGTGECVIVLRWWCLSDGSLGSDDKPERRCGCKYGFMNLLLLRTQRTKPEEGCSPAMLSAVQNTAPTPPAAALLREWALYLGRLVQSQWGSEPTHIPPQHAPSDSENKLHHNREDNMVIHWQSMSGV